MVQQVWITCDREPDRDLKASLDLTLRVQGFVPSDYADDMTGEPSWEEGEGGVWQCSYERNRSQA